MKNASKKLFITILLIFIHVDIAKAWIEVTYDSDGESIPFSLPACVGSMELCGVFSQDFDVRVTLVDKDNKLIEGTKTVEYKIFPADEPTTYEHRKTYEKTKNKSTESSLDPGWSQYEEFIGSNVAKLYNGSEEDYMGEYADYKTEVYEIPVPSNEFCYPDDWTCYNTNRDAFFKEASNKLDENGYIYIDEIGKKVSFLSLFLKQSGYTDVWNGFSDEQTVKKMIDFVTDEDGDFVNELKLLIEPVYTVNVQYLGVNHEFTGTAKQLATMLERSDPVDYLWFWPAIAMQNMYNLYNNMTVNTGSTKYDDTIEYYKSKPYNTFNLLYHYTEELVKMETYYENTLGGCKNGTSEGYGGYACTYASQQQKTERKKIEYIDRNGLYVDEAKKIFSDIAKPYGYPHKYDISGMGISVIKVVGKDTGVPVTYKENNCQYTITTCNNNKFEFSSKLTLGSKSDGDIFDCIYPSDASKIDKNQMKNISIYNEENDLWCYDDVKYNFDDLLYMDGKEYKKNQLLVVPKGKLIVDRTCFSKKDLTTLPVENLNSMFETNPNNLYQNNFTLVLNGKKYTYKREGSAYTNSYSSTKLKSKNNEEYYRYKTQLSYTYAISGGYDVSKGTNSGLNIGIKDYNIMNGLWNTTSINYETAYKGNAIVIDNTEYGWYTNVLSTDKDTIETQLKKALGLSNKLYNNVTSETATTQKEDAINISEWKKTIAYDSSTQKWKNNYTVTEKTGTACAFRTSIIGESPAQFRVVSLSNPFPSRDGSSRMPGKNWLTDTDNNVYEYIQNNRGVETENVYNQQPIYKVTLNTQSMIKIREYNKTHSYTDSAINCENGTGRMCISSFLRNSQYIDSLEGTCSNVKKEEITIINNRIEEFRKSGCLSETCLASKQNEVKELDQNKDGIVNELDYRNAEFYTCANKTAKSGG